MAMPFCVECGGELKFDRKLKQYVCQSCGLTYTDTELLEARQRSLGVDEEDEKRRKSREYLDWWFKSKKKE
jgi:putative hemolysin